MSILTLDEAKDLIAGSPGGTNRYEDADIQADIDAAEALIAQRVGPLSPTPVTVSVASNGFAVLPILPYVGPITAASVAGVATTLPGSLLVDFGIVRGLRSGSATITYTAGWATLPADIHKAIREQFKHVWSFRRGNTRTTDAERGAAHAMPWRVTELIAPYDQGPGFA